MAKRPKHIVCFSGGHSSALVAIEVVRKWGKRNVILLNHNIHSRVEDHDIKRFKSEVARYLGIKITFANMPGWRSMDQFDVVVARGAFKVVGTGSALCSHYMKVQPFHAYLDENFPDRNCIIYYGFDRNESVRIQRRTSILSALGYFSEYPLAQWRRTIWSTEEVGIRPPISYSDFKHANCTGCLKAGRQHWYVVYCLRPDIWERAKQAEDQIGYSIFRDAYLDELEGEFEEMWEAGVPADETLPSQEFWAMARRLTGCSLQLEEEARPCECVT
jgi:hypothetical protein